VFLTGTQLPCTNSLFSRELQAYFSLEYKMKFTLPAIFACLFLTLAGQSALAANSPVTPNVSDDAKALLSYL
jgi:hypothetical protein